MDLVDPSDGMEFYSMVPYAPQEESSDNPIYNQYSWSFVENDQLLEKVHGHPEVIQQLGRFSSPYMIQESSDIPFFASDPLNLRAPYQWGLTNEQEPSTPSAPSK